MNELDLESVNTTLIVQKARDKWEEALGRDGRSRHIFLAFNKEAANILTMYKLLQMDYEKEGIHLPDFLEKVTVEIKDEA
jgi:hypothetical protein